VQGVGRLLAVKPPIASINVVLPAPLGPISPVIFPGRTRSDTESTAFTAPYRTLTSRASSVLPDTVSI
jgi:hypothetical protein